jgi:uncharacterized Zn finger protein (UPF0148 family)
MGSHTWFSQCPHCGFEKMIVSSYDNSYFDAACPICGYSRWTEEKVPKTQDIELAKRTLSEMDNKQRDKALDQYYEDDIPVIARLNKHSG